ncbi:hypothetical protein V6N11_079261 [Hibiscus sabdariffa]|uniref:Uncharacterized protein n=1 Tax=Hibiscus sabdariffa TaxID=183260 RepID=A0ABR2RUW0_9ROSI
MSKLKSRITVVLVLSGGFLLLTGSLLIQPVKKLGDLKGISKLMLIELVLGSDFANASFVVVREMQCFDRVKSMLLWENWEILLLVFSVGVIVDALGQPVGGSLVFHKGGPDSVGDLSSYVVVVRDGKMELYHKKSSNCIQTETFGVEGVGQCIVADDENRSGEFVAIATPTEVPRNWYWELHPPHVPLEDVVDDGLLATQKAISFRKASVETVVDERFLSNPPTRAELLESANKNIIRIWNLLRIVVLCYVLFYGLSHSEFAESEDALLGSDDEDEDPAIVAANVILSLPTQSCLRSLLPTQPSPILLLMSQRKMLI